MAYKGHYLYGYRIVPIDFGWEYLFTIDEFASVLTKGDPDSHNLARAESLYEDFEYAKKAAKAVGWDGSYRDEKPSVFFLPFPNHADFAYGFVWKQENDGTCYVVSPFPLPFLDDPNPYFRTSCLMLAE